MCLPSVHSHTIAPCIGSFHPAEGQPQTSQLGICASGRHLRRPMRGG